MTKPKKYKFNSNTLSYELAKVSPVRHLGKAVVVLILSFVIFFLYLWMSSSVLRVDLPKTFLLRMTNARWQSKMELMNKKLDLASASLDEIAMRDNQIYRSLFGLGDIPSSVRNAGIYGVSRYEMLDEANPYLAAVSRKLDQMLKKATVQSRSFDEVESLSKKAGDIALSIPAICPLYTEPRTFRFSSPFGWRSDPVYRGSENHAGVDLASFPGNPIYATGDGKVELAEPHAGYGNCVIINHGFGYKTRYAHMNAMVLKVGDVVHRGDHVGYVGTTGKSTGNHLHYEVIYRGNPVDPMGFMDIEMPEEDYKNIVNLVPIQKGYRKELK